METGERAQKTRCRAIRESIAGVNTPVYDSFTELTTLLFA